MKQILSLALLLIVISSCSKEEAGTNQNTTGTSTFQTITVQNAGSLKSLLGTYINTVDTLILKGELNGTDVVTLRSMEKLSFLNLTDATIVAGGSTYSNSYSTQDNVFPDGAFEDYTGSITTVIMPTSVTSVGENAFNNCPGLTSVTIGSFVTSIEAQAFDGCKKLGSVVIPPSVTSIGDYAFSSCPELSSITIGSSVTSIGNNVFFGCEALKSITIPSSVTSIGGYVFENCTSLNSIVIPIRVKSIGDNAFFGCSGLTSVAIGDSVKAIGNSAFYNCIALKSVTLPSSVTTLGNIAFSNCTGLSSLTIGSGVTSIGVNAFKDCTGLTEIHCKKESPVSIDSNTFYNVNKTSCTLYVPRNCSGTYRLAVGWEDFTNIIEED
jgi:hypothetical protein